MRGEPLVFNQTNVNLCMFQQVSVFRKWWVQAERLQELGFSARVCASFSRRAVVTREHGRRTESPVVAIAKQLWQHLAQSYGHHCETVPGPFQLSYRGEQSFQQCYHDIADLEEQGGFGSAMESLLGKFEYWAPSVACLTELQSRSWPQHRSAATSQIDDRALKCALRFFDLRMGRGCTVVDTEVGLSQRQPQQQDSLRSGRPDATSTERDTHLDTLGTVLRRCTEEPITYGSLATHCAQSLP